MYSEGDKLKPLRDKYGMPVHKDLNWLWRPIRFTAPQCDLVRRDGYSFTQDGNVFLNSVGEDHKARSYPGLASQRLCSFSGLSGQAAGSIARSS